MPKCDIGAAPWYKRRLEINKIEIENGVTNIFENTFYDLGNVTDVSIADTVLNIGNSAFYNCSQLKEITLPSNLEGIGDSAFGNKKKKKITVPNSVKSMGNSAFFECAAYGNYSSVYRFITGHFKQ